MSLRKPQSDIQAVTFTQIAGAAVWVAAAPDGTFWVLSTSGLPSGDKFIYHFVNGNFVNVPGAATRLAVGPDNTLWALNAAGGIYYLRSGSSSFTGIAGGGSEISIASDGSAYVISSVPGGSAGRGIYRYLNGLWTQLPGAGITVTASIDSGTYANILGVNNSSISITPGGFYVTNVQGGIYYYNLNSGFVQLSGGAISLAPTASGGLFALGDPGAYQHGIYYNNLITGQWTSMPGAAVSLATYGNTVYAVGAAGGIYQSAITPVVTAAPLNGPNFEPCSNCLGGWGPTAVANELGYPVQSGYNGAGYTVAVVIDSNVSGNDVATYQSYFQVPQTGRVISYETIDGAATTTTSDIAEATLDVETIAGLAPGANIIVYIIPSLDSTQLTDAYNQIVSDKRANVVSTSISGCEFDGPSSTESTVLAAGAAAAIAFVAASGDQGSECYNGTGYQIGVGYPASDPSVIGVGGTETLRTISTQGLSVLNTTVAWNDTASIGNAQLATGGGVSTYFALPSYQSGIAGLASTQFRNVPDIAMPASYTGLYLNSAWHLQSGTSWSAPLFAAMLADTYTYCKATWKYPAGLPYLALSKAGYNAFVDVTSGNNQYNGSSQFYYATAGYDNTTGIGVPNGMAFAQAICPNRVPVQALAPPNSIAASSTRRSAQAYRSDVTPHVPGLIDQGRRSAIEEANVQIVLRPSESLADDEHVITTDLQSAGFTITRTFSNHLVIDAQAPTATIEQYFQTELHAVTQAAYGTKYLPIAPITVPATIAPYVGGVTLDDIVIAKMTSSPAGLPFFR